VDTKLSNTPLYQNPLDFFPLPSVISIHIFNVIENFPFDKQQRYSCFTTELKIMGYHNVKAKTSKISLLGWLFICLGVLELIVTAGVLKTPFFNFKVFFPYLQYLLMFEKPWGLIWGGIYVLSGLGLLFNKAWAKELIALLILTSLFLSFKRAWMWDSPGSINSFTLQSLMAALILWLMSGKLYSNTPELELKTKKKDFIPVFLSVLAVISISMILGLKLYYQLGEHCGPHQPFFRLKPKAVTLPAITPDLKAYRKIELFATALFIPKNYVILSFFKSKGEPHFWMAMLSDPKNPEKGIINFNGISDNDFMYQLMSEKHELFGFKDAYEFERVFLSNNWSPVYMEIRKEVSVFGDTSKIEAFKTKKVKGFIKIQSNKPPNAAARCRYDVSFYSHGKCDSRNMIFEAQEKHLFRNEIYKMIASVDFNGVSKLEAQKYYLQGLEALSKKEPVNAQFQFANAYSLAPGNPDYAFMFAKSIYKNCPKSSICAENILKQIVKSNPTEQKAKLLLQNPIFKDN
jgi:hypothetical protein